MFVVCVAWERNNIDAESTSKLLTAYPLLYRYLRYLRDQEFECGDGWFDLVWQVSAEIEAVAQLEGIPKTAEAWPVVGVFKNKFGTLRVQFQSRVSEAIEAVVTKAYGTIIWRYVSYAVRLPHALSTRTARR